MDSTNNNPKLQLLQQYKEQMIQRSKEAETTEESQYFLCLADLYNIAISDEKATMFGSALTVTVGTDGDAVTKVSINIYTNFTARTNFFEVSFSQWQAVPNKMLREVPEKKFSTAEDAYHFIVGLALKINAFFNNIKL